MKHHTNAFPPGQTAWRSLYFAFLFACLSFSAFDSHARSQVAKPSVADIGQIQSAAKTTDVQAEDCEDDEACEELLELCDEGPLCTVLLRFCQGDAELCWDIIEDIECEESGDCEDYDEDVADEFDDCDVDEEECEEFDDCDIDEEDCDEFFECDDEEECEEFAEDFDDCDIDEEDCDEFFECDDEEECEELAEDFDDCDVDEEDCDEFFECDDEEECEEVAEDFDDCDVDEEDCDDFFECDEGEEDCNFSVVSTGFVNPNPEQDQTLMAVEPEAANRASRFLSQATLGANYPLVTYVASLGEEAWLENQFQQPIGYLFPMIDFMYNKAEEVEEQSGEEAVESFFGGALSFHLNAWWTQVMTSPDLVRQRVAMALSEIFVISSNVEIIGESPLAISKYYDTLLTHSLGNYRDLLRDITLDPAMAIYLSHLNNEKADAAAGRFPDENYAREVMQLFSIGLFELNPDGSRKKDANGNDIPTYGQEAIREFAKIFTGLSMNIADEGFGGFPQGDSDFYPYASTRAPLVMFDAFHSPGEKRLLNGTVVPAGQTGMQDIEAAIDNLFNHPNVGPFIGKQLIQRLVTSNPSPAYIARVSAAFNGETGSPRGDMQAVIRAILLDPEARTAPVNANAQDGRLREPFLRLVRLMRSFNATTPDRTYATNGYDVFENIKQYVFFSPSVFNFFLPGYSPNGELKDAGLVAPEFQITNASTIIEIKNLVDQWLETGRFDAPTGRLSPQSVSFAAELALAGDADALLDRLDTLMTYGSLSATTRSAIKTVIESEPEAELKVKKAVYLMAISPDFATAI